jgi:hypothetical protein
MWAIPFPLTRLNTFTTSASISCYHRFDIQPSTIKTTESLVLRSSYKVRPRNTFASCKESSRACIPSVRWYPSYLPKALAIEQIRFVRSKFLPMRPHRVCNDIFMGTTFGVIGNYYSSFRKKPVLSKGRSLRLGTQKRR